MNRILLLIFSLLAIPRALAAPDVWLQASQPDWKVVPLLNVGESVQGYRLVGVPDGLGTTLDKDGRLSIFMNHELAADKGIKRRHGARGAFVSHWILDIDSLKVVSGEDWIRKVMLWNGNSFVEHPSVAFSRLCSADLPVIPALFDAASGKGFDGRLFLNGEEDKAGGRAFAHVVSGGQAGTSYELPHLGKIAWENVVANPASGDMTLVMGMDDTPGGQVYVYIGQKQFRGGPVVQAGLFGGVLHAVKAEGERFRLVTLGNVAGMDVATLEKASREAGATAFMRPEDGAWDTRDPRVFYFSTTDKIDGSSQLFRMVFDDLAHPERGGSIQAVLNARDIGAQMFDNLTVNGDGEVMIEEDPGDNPHMAGIWKFDPVSGKAERVASVSPSRFGDKTSAGFVTQDEENSGIIEITSLLSQAPWFKPGRRYYLGVLQVHALSQDQELVEDGQLYLLEGPAR